MLRIDRFDSLPACAHLREQANALNLRARRPCPYSTFEYYENFVAHDEYLDDGSDPLVLFLAVMDDDRLLGYAALRRRRTMQLAGAPAKIEWLVTRDTDRPHLVAAPEDEGRCAEAIVDHLIHRERGWTYIELGDQEDESPLARRLQACRSARFDVRCPTGHEHSSLPLTWPDGTAYFRALSKKKRETVSHDVRKLMGSGRLELLRSTTPSSARTLLRAYLDVERRSWKHEARVGIGRHPRRIAFYDGLFDARQPLRAIVSLLVLDGVPVAGMISGEFARTLYLIEIAYDRRLERLSPGQALHFFTVLSAFDAKCEGVNMRSDSTYWKSEWLATTSGTRHVRLYRRASLAWWLALAGDVRRGLKARFSALAARANPGRHRAARAAAPTAAGDPLTAGGLLVADVLTRDGHVRRTGPDELAALCPWTARQGAGRNADRPREARTR